MIYRREIRQISFVLCLLSFVLPVFAENKVAVENKPADPMIAIIDSTIAEDNRFGWLDLIVAPNAMTKSEIQRIVGPFKIEPARGFHMVYCGGFFHGDTFYKGYKIHIAFYADGDRICFLKVFSPNPQHRVSFTKLQHYFKQRFPEAEKSDARFFKDAAMYSVKERFAIYLERDALSLFPVGKD